MTKSYEMPQFPESYWQTYELPVFDHVKEDATFDVAIVGGGIAGITTGYLLAKEGVKVAIVEAGRILTGTTGHTTAKMTAQHGIIYHELLNHFGKEQARMYYDANSDALKFMQSMISEYNIDCDYSDQDAVIYADTEKGKTQLENELKAYEALGIQHTVFNSIPFNLPISLAASFSHQGQFHPLKYLEKIVKLFVEAGGTIYENTAAADIEDGDSPKLLLRNGSVIHCQFIVAASHYPFCDKKGLIFTRMHVERAYVLGLKAEKPFSGGMYISAETPTRSFRTTPFNGEDMLLVAGEGHKTGQGIDTLKHYIALEEFTSDVFGIKEYPYRWSAQDMYTLDKVPYVGSITENQPRILYATGFGKWGMTNGTVAAKILSDTILGRDNSYRELFAPNRFHADPDIKKFVQSNLDVAKHLLKGKLEVLPLDPSDLGLDEGSAVMINGKRAGAYRDLDGELHIVDTTCKHLGCEVEWNNGERTWDCPCHGSRYSIDGEVLNGPAVRPLDQL